MNDLVIEISQKELLFNFVSSAFASTLFAGVLCFGVGRLFEYGSITGLLGFGYIALIALGVSMILWYLLKHFLNDSAIKNVRKTQQASRFQT